MAKGTARRIDTGEIVEGTIYDARVYDNFGPGDYRQGWFILTKENQEHEIDPETIQEEQDNG